MKDSDDWMNRLNTDIEQMEIQVMEMSDSKFICNLIGDKDSLDLKQQ